LLSPEDQPSSSRPLFPACTGCDLLKEWVGCRVNAVRAPIEGDATKADGLKEPAGLRSSLPYFDLEAGSLQ